MSKEDYYYQKICGYIKKQDIIFGLWINALWGEFNKESVEEAKGLFLHVLRKLLDEGHVVMFPPGEFFTDGVSTVPLKGGYTHIDNSNLKIDNVWDATTDEIIDYIEQHWPNQVTDMDDMVLNLFWYDNYCPRLAWLDRETKGLLAS